MSEHVEVHRGGEVTFKSPEAVRMVARLLGAGVQVATSGDRIPASAMVRHVVGAAELAAARASAAESSEDPDRGCGSGLPVDDLIDTQEAAEMTGLTERTMRNWCSKGRLRTAMQMGRAWSVSRAEVASQVRGRAA